MKRDLDLIRRVLRAIEDSQLTTDVVRPEDFGAKPEHWKYNMDLAIEAGWLKGATSAHPVQLSYTGLSNAGHDFVNITRDDDQWGTFVREKQSLSVQILLERMTRR
jgi:hypothetical protein